ncbi:cell wall metabolism sensor histidine kinase WalK [Peptoniphilus sp. GNH]|nr:ATPase/histidine kinase/DNA gyrase B/HSP90 domain protein [Clostridiales bacterium KA00134]UHR02310.1 cell wall metabolism sensor histidine kinase WalK [Peptoniphilus sp. GNH]
MFQSIKWRFIIIYFILVLISMGIVGSFIIARLEVSQINSITENMKSQVQSIINASDNLNKEDWVKSAQKIDNTLKSWRFAAGDKVYVIKNSDQAEIVSSSADPLDSVLGKSALTYKNLRPDLIMEAFSGNSAEGIVEDDRGANKEKHLLEPVISANGDIEGVFYMTSSLNPVYQVIRDAGRILTYATAIALLITSILGIIISSSITRPIKNVTKVAKEMAQGNFDQKVEVMSNDEIGKLATMFNILTGELKDTIKKMDLERSKLDTIINYMAEGVLAVDASGRLIHANPTAEELLNLEEGSIGQDFNLNSLNIKNLDYSKPSSLKATSELEVQGKFYSIKYAPYRSDRGHYSGLIIVVQDMTKEHRLEKMRKEFVANVSHELKTPITTIKSYTETLLDSDMDKQSSNYFLQVIDRENNRMQRLVNDLLQLSNVDYGALKLDLQSLDTRRLIERARDSLDLMVKEKNQKVYIDVENKILPIKADPSFAEQVLINILSNAVKYTGNNGVIEIQASSRFGRVTISVKDNGIGIPKNDMERIFERFYRVEKGRSRAMGGTGLGLSIAKEMMELMRGKIKIYSEFKKGTTVSLEFLAGEKDELV